MIDAERWRRVDRLFADALERPVDRRQAFLDAATAGEPEIRREVEELLAIDAADADRFLDRPISDLHGAPPELESGGRLGPYRIVRRLSSGGMGTVYAAVRDDGQYRQDVAIKILRSGLGEGQARARFLAERQILARLEHPNIARLYDGGETAGGRPFLVMELVDGLPLDEFCDRHRLTLRERLALFLRVCAAVGYAHQNLLVHRDLKPANILVTATGEPKLLDFGIAKRLEPDATPGGDAANRLTRTGLRLMTPSYASPEQVKGEPITTASDVYSLGVLLYELLAGRSPYRVAAGALPHEIERAICEADPARPSTGVLRAVTAGNPAGSPEEPEPIARARRTRPHALARQLRGDLDTVVLTALQKAPARRYRSVEPLASDIERYLADLPVYARPDSVLYRARKFLRRHRVGAAAALALAIVVIGFLASLVAQGRSLTRERDKARYTLSSLIGVFNRADPYRRGGETLDANGILEQGAKRAAKELASQPDLQAALLDAIGQVDSGLGRTKDAQPLLEKALALRLARPGTDPMEIADSLEHVAGVRYESADFRGATALLRRALSLERRALGADDIRVAKTLNQLGMTLAASGAAAEAETRHREAIDLARRLEGPYGATVGESLVYLARIAADRGDYLRAEETYRQGVAIERSHAGEDDPGLLLNLTGLAETLRLEGKEAEAETLLRSVARRQERVLGADHPDFAVTLNDLAMVLRGRGREAEAEGLFRRALAIYQPRLGESHLRLIAVRNNLAASVQAQGRLDEALALHEEVLAVRRRLFGDGDPQVAQSLLLIAGAYRELGRYESALDFAKRALGILRTRLGDGHPLVAYPLREIGRTLAASGDPGAAEPYLRQSLEIRRKALPPTHPDLAKAAITLGACLTDLRRYDEAETLLREARASLAGQVGAKDDRVREADDRLAELARAKKAEAPGRRGSGASPGFVSPRAPSSYGQ